MRHKTTFIHSFKATGWFPSLLLLKQQTVVRGMNPDAMTIINPQKEYWPGIEPAASCSQVCSATDRAVGLDQGRY